MRRLAPFLPALLLPASLAAQSVTATATCQGFALDLTVAGQSVQSATVPAGTPLVSATRSLVNLSPVVVASIGGTIATRETEVAMTVNHTLVSTSATAGASIASDTLLTVNVTRPIAARIELDWQGVLPAGAVLPIVTLDVDNDGTVDLNGAPNRVVSQVRNLTGSHSYLLHVDGSQQGSSLPATTARWSITVRVIPASSNIVVQPMLPGCTNLYELRAGATFAGGVMIERNRPAVPQALDLLVVGFTPAFAPLPIGNCYLLPAPDLLFYASSLPVQLGPGLAPLAFYVQTVTLGGSLQASNSLRVWMY